MNSRSLENIVKVLLNNNSSHGELLDSARGLSEFFENFSSVSTKDSHFESNDSTHTFLNSGVAISPLDAAICTNEYMRTVKYLRGVYEALNDLLEKFKGEKLHILYAGCGPYGTLIIPLLHLFDSKDIEITFLDIHTTSLKSIKSILKALHLEQFACEYVKDDATKYKVSKQTHVMITETMKAAFFEEPQVAISLNLLPQLCEGGEFIPNRVLIGFEAAQYKTIEENNMLSRKKESIYFCDVLDLDSSKDMWKENLICTKEYFLAQNLDENFNFQLTTDIYVYKEHILRENECSLNIPAKVKLDKKISMGDKIYFSYEFSNRPKIKCSLDRTGDEYKDYIPQKVFYKNGQENIVWYNMKGKRFTKPFFDGSFNSSLEKKYSLWKELQDVSKELEDVKPSGFIFHTSRCGSTLISQLLAQFDENIVLSEAQLIHEALTIDENIKVSKEEKTAILKDTIKVLGQKRFEKEENLFIKFDAWSIAELPFILEVYPDVPWVFLYRNSVEVLVSQKRKRGFFTIPKAIKGKIFNQITSDTHFDDYHKEVIYEIFKTALKYKDLPNGLFIDYKDLKSSIIDTILPHFKLDLSKDDIKKIDERLSFDAKEPKQNFKDDTKDKNDEASEDIKSFCKDHIFDTYQKLDMKEAIV